MSPSTRPGRVLGRPGPRRAIAAGPSAGRRPGSRGAARRWSPGPAAGSRSRRAGESWWSARPGTGPAPPGPCNSAQPLMRAGALSAAGASRAGSTSAGGCAPGPGRVLVRPHHRRVRRDRPRPARPPDHSQRAAGPGSSPRSHPLTSGGAGYRRSSSSRTAPAGPATGTRPGSGRRSRRSPAGDHSTGAPAADEPAATAPAAPTPHPSGHAASAAPHPRRNPSGNTTKIYGTRPSAPPASSSRPSWPALVRGSRGGTAR